MRADKYIFAIMVALLFVGCTNKEKQSGATKKKADITFAYVTKKVVTPIDEYADEAPKLTCDVQMQLAESSDKEIEQRINREIIYTIFGYENIEPECATDSFFTAIKNEYLSLRPEYYNEKAMNNSAPWFNYSYTIKSKVERGYNGIINYTSTIDTFTGGAHGSFATTMLNFDPATGEVIELSDFFKENYEEVLIDRLIRALIKKSGAKSFEELQDMGYLVLNDMFVTNNFVLGEEEILFHFNHYDIAPYALGTCDLSFTYDELKDIIKD